MARGGNANSGARYEQRLNHPRRCSAHSSITGKPCGAYAVRGTLPPICKKHGGWAPAVRKRAQERLNLAAEKLAQELLGICLDDDMTPETRLKAIALGLQYALGRPAATVDVTVGTPKAFEEIFESITSDTRSESRAARGIVDPLPALPAPISDSRYIDADIDSEPEPEVYVPVRMPPTHRPTPALRRLIAGDRPRQCAQPSLACRGQGS